MVFDLIKVYTIFYNLVKSCFDFFQLSNNEYNWHKHSIKPRDRLSTDGYHNFFSDRICLVLNKLLKQIISASNLTAFKTLITE